MDANNLKTARILIVDDEPTNVRLLERLLTQGGYTSFKSTTDACQVLPLFAEFQSDILLLDLHMPNLDGFAVMELLRPRIPPETYFPVLVLTADITPEAKRRALAGGARDFLTKPRGRGEGERGRGIADGAPRSARRSRACLVERPRCASTHCKETPGGQRKSGDGWSAQVPGELQRKCTQRRDRAPWHLV